MLTPTLPRILWLAAALVFHAVPLQAQEVGLKGEPAWRTLVGNTVVVATRNGSYTEYYDPEGAVRRLDADGTAQGRWVVTGDRTCFDYPDDDDHICLHVSVQGTSGRFTDPDGVSDSFQILPGNAKGL